MRDTLVATLGTTPAVLTEAIYYHHTRLGIQFNDIHVVTTADGAATLRRRLLGRRGALERLWNHLGTAGASTAGLIPHIHVLRGADGEPLDDVRNTADGAAVADQVLALLRELCRDDSRRVHATLAGGRKVMGVYLHAALQLTGRPGDRLFHVLTHPLLEKALTVHQHGNFLFPTGPIRVAGAVLQPEELVTCVDIPLLFLAGAMRGDGPYHELVAHRQRELQLLRAPLPMVVDVDGHCVMVGSLRVRLTREESYWLYSIARLHAEGTGRLPVADLIETLQLAERGRVYLRGSKARVVGPIVERLRRWREQVRADDADDTAAWLYRACGTKEPGIKVTVSRINAKLRRHLGIASSRYEICGGRHQGGYGLTLDAELVQFAR